MRSVHILHTGRPRALRDWLALIAAGRDLPLIDGDGHARLWLEHAGGTTAAREHLLVLAPDTAHEKERPGFADAWPATAPY